MDWLVSYAGSVPQQFFDPGKRLFVGYLVSAFLIAVVWIVFVQRRRPACRIC
jgi:hypothetical protein